MSELHTQPPEIGPQRGVEITCESGNHPPQRIWMEGMTRKDAIDFAGIMDGTSTFYAYPPREYPVPESRVAKCGICGDWITCQIFGFDDPPAPADTTPSTPTNDGAPDPA